MTERLVGFIYTVTCIVKTQTACQTILAALVSKICVIYDVTSAGIRFAQVVISLQVYTSKLLHQIQTNSEDSTAFNIDRTNPQQSSEQLLLAYGYTTDKPQDCSTL